MTPIELVGLKVDLRVILHTLRRLGCIHIEDLSEMVEVSARPLTLDRETLRLQEDLFENGLAASFSTGIQVSESEYFFKRNKYC